MRYQPVIGLEIHAELLTDSKVFCTCQNEFGGSENTRVCPRCSGLPGTLPPKAVGLHSQVGADIQHDCYLFSKCVPVSLAESGGAYTKQS